MGDRVLMDSVNLWNEAGTSVADGLRATGEETLLETTCQSFSRSVLV
jgi:hypothetical protein